MTRLVLLGGGHAHLQVLRSLCSVPLAAARVTLVTPSPQVLYSGMVPGLVAGHYTAAQCCIALAPLARRAGADLVQGAACALDARARRLRLADGRAIDYDLLSIDIGSEMDRDAIAGAGAHGLFVRPIESFAQRWQAAVADAAGRAPPRIVVVGGGAAGFELALAMRWRLRGAVALVAGRAGPLADYPPAVRRLAQQALARLGVQVHRADGRAVHERAVELDDGARLDCDLAVLAVGASAAGWLRGSGLALDSRGFVATGPTLQSLSHGEVFAAGDAAARDDAPRPRSGVYAVRAGAPLADNLRRHVAAGGAGLRPYLPQRRSLNLLACGAQHAIVAWGPLAAAGRWAWRWKDRIDRGFVGGFGAAGGVRA